MNEFAKRSGMLAIALIASCPVFAQQWRGLYVGGHLGSARTTGKMLAEGRVLGIVTPEFSDFQTTKLSLRSTDAVFGAQIGYNWQNEHAVFGLEGDYSRPNANETRTVTAQRFDGSTVPGAFVKTSQDVDWLSTVRGRVGYTGSANWLIYLTGGIAIADVTYVSDVDASQLNGFEWHYPSTYSKLRTGLAVGAGAEWAAARHLTARLEYMHYDLGKRTQEGRNKTVPDYPTDIQYTWVTEIDSLRLGLNYRF